MVKQRYALVSVLLLGFALSGCVAGTQLKTQTADPKSLSGTFDLYLYGCRYPQDYEHAAFLISPDAKYPFSLYVPATSYKVKKAVPAEQAMTEANAFVRCGVNTVEETRVHRILDDGGGTIGYEVLPRYPATDLSGSDPLWVSYTLKDGTVTVYIRLFPDVEKKLNRGSSPGGS